MESGVLDAVTGGGQSPLLDGRNGAFRVRAMVRGKGVRRVARKVVNNMSVLFIEGIGVPHGTFVAKIPTVGSTECLVVGPAEIVMDIVPVAEGKLRIYRSDRMFAVIVTTRKNGRPFQYWVELAGIAGKTGISEVRVPMPSGTRGSDGREYIRLTDLTAFLGSDLERCLAGSRLKVLSQIRYIEMEKSTANDPRVEEPTYVGPDPRLGWIRASDAKDACILAFVGDGT